MNYQQTLAYLFTQLPMYQRVGKAAYKVDLTNTHLLCKLLKNPENKFKSVHVAGTNGKGSTSHMLASVLQEAGYKVGLYTSPHLKDFRERVKINGEMIPESEVITFVSNYKTEFEKINLSFFEWTVGLAFDYFATQKVDIAIIETGLGGRLDSTNVVIPEVSVITNIGIDHTQFLGDTLEKIAIEKAGIIKFGVSVVIGETQAETSIIFQEKVTVVKTSIQFADKAVNEIFQTDLKGVYQRKNVKTCITTINTLIEKGWKISQENIERGLQHVVKNTGILGRWQILSKQPLIICDTGHNEEGVKEIMSQIKTMKFDKLHVVFGAVNDKSIDKVLDLFPKDAEYYFCEAKIPRALAVNELFELGKQKGLKGKQYTSVENALSTAKKNALANDLIFVGGSTFVVAEVI
ncbi:MAG: bifunctional folylpolyglutamate synthase/dihydrofolate synthase [Flavobacteriales bacterium]|nr:bifunctional folylpolyglutamate synthase/dihydrofolate synthase [Flavobacteriales bacterium]